VPPLSDTHVARTPLGINGKTRGPQPLGLRVRASLAVVGKGEQLYLVVSPDSEVQHVRLSFGPVGLEDHLESQYLGIKVFAAFIVVREDRDMMDGLYVHASVAVVLAAFPIFPRCVSEKPVKYFSPYPIPLSM